jgi:hypothetical protein
VGLFVDRAREARPGFEVTEENAPIADQQTPSWGRRSIDLVRTGPAELARARRDGATRR